jgi:glycyl-tRNA synthetase beta chain
MATFLLEVGTEELPARFVDSAIAQWRSRIPTALAEHHLTSEHIAVYGTPRRLAVLIDGLPERQPDQEVEYKGPSVQAAYKEDKPTKALEGFARSRNVALEDLEIRPTDKGEFVFVQQTIPGRPTADILVEQIPQWILGIEGPRLMRWGDGDLRFSRPIHWIVALLDRQVLPLELQNSSIIIKSGRTSRGHRVLHPHDIEISQAADYLWCLRQACIEADPEQRKTLIQDQIQTIAKTVKGTADISVDLLQEVVQLVEWPSAVIGNFDAEFLQLPPEVTTTVMVNHQRYFPVRKSQTSTALLPHFITISNGDPAKADIIAAGNERVIRARLADGQFFYQADLGHPLKHYLPKLEQVTFQEALGSMRAKTDRISEIATLVATQLHCSKSESKTIQRAALLCKADLVTQMVGEFPELQGVMGETYALASGETQAVATAIAEHYLPKGAGDQLPQTLPGQIIGIADRMDTLVSIFGLGLLPTGSSDPFALRRSANAIIHIIWEASLPLDLVELCQRTIEPFTNIYEKAKPELLFQQLQEFLLQRLRSLLEEHAINYDLINAVLGDNDAEYTERALRHVLEVRDRAQFLQTIRNDGRLDTIYETINRASKLSEKGDLATTQLDPIGVVKPALFQKTSEQAFYDALLHLNTQLQGVQTEYDTLVQALSAIAPVVSQFFDGPDSVLVMDPDPAIKQNRLNLLGLLRNRARTLANFGAIVKSAEG